MRNGHADEIAKLIEPGRVHRRVYSDPDVFELEMERIFGRAWLLRRPCEPGAEPGRLHHHRPRPPAGDHVPAQGWQRAGAAQPLRPSRAKGGQRTQGPRQPAGLLLPRLEPTTPTASSSPCRCRKAAARDSTRPTSGSRSAPRVGEYRGFVFASLARNGTSFEDHIGPMKGNIDDLVDRAPDGELALDVGMHRYVYNGNWKLQLENVLDSITCRSATPRPSTRRACSSPAARAIARAPPSSRPRRSRPPPRGKIARATSSATVTAGPATPRSTTASARARPIDEYKRMLARKVGAERAAQILTPRLHNSLIYPNMSIMGLNIHVRVIKPIAVDRTEVTIYPIRLCGAPTR